MQESVYKALKRQRIQKREIQLSFDKWELLKEFENLVFVTKNGKPVSQRSFQPALY